MTMLVIIVLIFLGFALYDYFDSKDWQQITCVDRINLVFEDRNKKYGAYSIRRDYNDLVLFIVLGMVGLFTLFSIVSFSIRISPEEIKIPVVEMDTTLLTLEAPPIDPIETIESPYKIGGGGSGTPDNSKYDPTPNDMTAQESMIPTSSDVKNKPGKGNKNNGTNTQEEASTTVKSPFSGSGGSGGGDKGGRGKGFGNDDGNGTGPGPKGDGSGSPVRKVTQYPDLTGIKSDESCEIVLILRIDASGTIITTPQVDRVKTSTDNTVLINQVAQRVKAQMKFSASPGAKTITRSVPFTVKAN